MNIVGEEYIAECEEWQIKDKKGQGNRVLISLDRQIVLAGLQVDHLLPCVGRK